MHIVYNILTGDDLTILNSSYSGIIFDIILQSDCSVFAKTLTKATPLHPFFLYNERLSMLDEFGGTDTQNSPTSTNGLVVIFVAVPSNNALW